MHSTACTHLLQAAAGVITSLNALVATQILTFCVWLTPNQVCCRRCCASLSYGSLTLSATMQDLAFILATAYQSVCILTVR